MSDERDWNRRRILKTAVAGSLASALNSTGSGAKDKTATDRDRHPTRALAHLVLTLPEFQLN